MSYSTEPLSIDPKESAIKEALECVKQSDYKYKPTKEEIINLYTVREGGYTGIWFWGV